MAIENTQTKLARDFWPAFRRKGTWLIIAVQLLLIVALGAVLYLLEVFEDHMIASVIILVVVALLGSLTSLWIFKQASKPSKDLLAAIVHITGEPTTSTPPNPNDARYQKNGFKDILQTLYELASQRDAQPAPAPMAAATVAPAAPVVTNDGFLKSALDETICGFVVFNHERAITFSNQAAPTRVDQNGATLLELMFPEKDTFQQWLDECDTSAVHAEKTWTRLADRLPDQEGRRFFDVFASYDKGAASETVLTLIDRTKLYNVGEQELDFIAFAAHELRGPITVIRGYLDVLEDELGDNLAEEHKELFRRLTVSANRLSGYVNNILNTSRFDRRHLKLHLVESSLADIYDVIKDDMQLRANAQNRLLSVTIPADIPTVPADPTSLSEVMGNLIDNAIKYSNEGGAITVTAAQKGDLVEFSVEDHGIGMPGSVVSNLFQKFYRSHRSRETVAGTGIGLYISKAIVESHGGTIGVRSEDGRGSAFTVALPIYATVADKLKAGNNTNENLIATGDGWIKNHSMYRG